ncbi:tripartite tricarboxylate transporter substrate binding protein [Comamonas humi]
MRRLFLTGALLYGMAACALAQNASQPLTFVVPYPAGGPLDASAKLLAEGAKSALGSITVANKPGAGGATGAALIAQAKPGENLVVMGAVATHAILPWLSKLPYDAQKDFKPLILVARVPNVLVMTKARAQALNLKSTADVVAYLKAHPNGLSMGSGGHGSIGHIAGEMLKTLANLQMNNRPYAGAAPAQKALLGGEVDLVFDNLASALPLIKSGELVALSVTTPDRNIALPNVRSVNEEVPGFDVATWFGVFAPASLPDADAKRYALAFQDALTDPRFKGEYQKMGIAPEDMRLQELAQYVKQEGRKYQFLIKATRIQAQAN